MDTSVESLCTALARHHLLSVEEVRNVRTRWQAEAGAAVEDYGKFCRWLVSKGLATEYQVGVLGRGRGEQLWLNRYKLLDRLGTGRMAGVYKAVHELGQVVAVKILPPSKAKDKSTFARFQREARLARKLTHPNIVRTFQTAQANGLHYLVMEYLEGETLEEVLQKRGKLPPPEAVRLVHQALLGLQHMHEQGQIHRDLKPGNLMLVVGRRRGGDPLKEGTIKILDIGTGRALFDEDAPPSTKNVEITAAGEILGTPEYMAPEQARDAHSADVRADIYSLGCVLYHALAGRPPFVDTNRVRILVKHATEAPPPLREINPAVPEGLQQIVDWMLAKDPARRYPTPERAAQALQVFLEADHETGTAEVAPEERAYLEWLEKESPPEEEGGAVQVAQPVPAPMDVELVAVPAPSAGEKQQAPPAAAPNPPNYLMLSLAAGAGAAVVLALVVIVLLLVMALGRPRTPPPAEPPAAPGVANPD